MPRSERDFIREMEEDGSGHHRMRVRFENEGKDILAFMVQYETLLDGTWCPVIRYDTGHGEAHRDTYDPSGEQIEKIWLGATDPPFNELFTSRYEDLKKNWWQYFQAFLNRRGSRS